MTGEHDLLIPHEALLAFAQPYLEAMGCTPGVASEVAEHLVEADLAGVYSHGVFRLEQYLSEAEKGVFDPAGQSRLTKAEGGGPLVDGGKGFGMPAMRLATEEAIRRAGDGGAAAIGVCNVAHTGRIGAFAEQAAKAECFCIIAGGAGRREWRQVTPFGGSKAILPTNPYAFSIPGGARGPVTIDFATSAGAGGKIYAAKAAGRPLPEGLIVDKQGRPSTDPEDYFQGGALLPMAGPKGYGLALIAELLGEAVFHEAQTGMNWMVIAIKLSAFREGASYRRVAEEILEELRTCPPAEGFARVEVPGERDAALRSNRLKAGVPFAPKTIQALNRAAEKLGVPPLRA